MTAFFRDAASLIVVVSLIAAVAVWAEGLRAIV